MTEEARGEPILERVLAGRLMLLAAQRSSSSMDAFSGWMLAGFGGAFALLLANIEGAATVLRVGSLRSGAWWFLAAVLLSVGQKSLASLVASSTAAGIEGEMIGRELADGAAEFDARHIFREMHKAVLPPFRWIVRRAFEKSQVGDHAAGGRLCLQLAQIQGWVVFVETLLLIAGVVLLLRGLAV
jgi:hypothetical protein